MTKSELTSIVERYQKLAAYIVRHKYFWLTRYGYEVEDLVQEAMCAIIVAAPKYNPAYGRETAYYTRCILYWFSHFITSLNRQCSKANLGADSLDRFLPGSETDLMSTLADDNANYESAAIDGVAVRNALDWLFIYHPRQAMAIQLCYLDGLTIDEAGKQMGLTRVMVGRHIQHGLKNLRDYLTNGGKEVPPDAD